MIAQSKRFCYFQKLICANIYLKPQISAVLTVRVSISDAELDPVYTSFFLLQPIFSSLIADGHVSSMMLMHFVFFVVFKEPIAVTLFFLFYLTVLL